MKKRRRMKNLREYGSAPFKAALIHGGPGAAGEMAPAALELSSDFGVLEPLQTKTTVDGQVEELYETLCRILPNSSNLSNPITLIGYSWGAWLSFIFTAQNPKLVKKLILVGSGPFEEKYASNIMQTRLNRLSKKEKSEALSLINTINTLNDSSINRKINNKEEAMSQFGNLMSKADSFDPIPQLKLEDHKDIVDLRFDIFQSVWKEASKLRRSGELLEMGHKIQCPTLAIHGDYDPHPYEGVKIPLSSVLKDFHFILLKNCGHKPWNEKAARDRFFDILKKEIE